MAVTRNAFIDGLRALAILMVVTVHTWSLARIDAEVHPVLATIYSLFYRWGVPLFVMISGALQLSAPTQPLGIFYKKRYTRILIPFLIWSLVVYAMSIFAGKYEAIHSIGQALLFYIPYMLTNKINEAYWFIGLIVVLYAVTPFLQRALQPCSRKELIGICLCWLGYIIVQDLYPSFYLLEYTSRLTHFLGYYILGYLLYREWGSQIRVKENKLIRTVSDGSYMTYLTHMVFITPFYMLISFNGGTAPLWQLILIPITTSIIVVAFCTLGAMGIKKLFPYYQHLGIN